MQCRDIGRNFALHVPAAFSHERIFPVKPPHRVPVPYADHIHAVQSVAAVVHVYGKGAVSRIDAGLFDYAYVVAFYLPLADSDRNLHVSFFSFVKVDTYIKLLSVALF